MNDILTGEGHQVVTAEGDLSASGASIGDLSVLLRLTSKEVPSVRTHKVYVRRDNTAVVTCPNCGTVRTINVGKFRGRKYPLKAKCTCRTAFSVFFEFRKVHRKSASLQGYYNRLSGPRGCCAMLVRDVSLSGIRFVTLASHNLSEGDEGKVRFTLDDRRRSEIERNVVVRCVEDKNVGCEFTGTVPYDKNLGFYLMS